jgi:hypothetical protein
MISTEEENKDREAVGRGVGGEIWRGGRKDDPQDCRCEYGGLSVYAAVCTEAEGGVELN